MNSREHPSAAYPEALRHLFGLARFGMVLGLGNTRRLARLAGQPERGLRFIHVAGTNGKGSTCAMLESVYRAAGYRTGLFTSPHLVSFRERLQVNRRLIPAADVVRLTGELRGLIARENAGAGDPLEPTFFEFVTVLALRWFAEQRCDVVIWETGLGGRLDATNLVTPLASVLTSIGLEHQQWLGDTLEKIAGEKAGIIKPGVPVIACGQPAAVMTVFERVAAANGSPLTVAGGAAPPGAGEPLVSLAGSHQQLNAGVARATIEALQFRLPVAPEHIIAGLSAVHWPGRLQKVQHGGQTLVLDCAHNPHGFAALVATLAQSPPARPTALILGLVDDKDAAAICALVADVFDSIHLVPVGTDRSARTADLARHLVARKADGTVTEHPGFNHALAACTTTATVVIAGSFYLVGEALEALELAPPDCRDERRLNDWRP